MTSTILSLLFLTIGLLLIIAWGWKQLPLSVKKFLKDIWAQPFLRRLLKWLVLIIAILAVINWLSNRPKTSSTIKTTNLCSAQGTSLPFNRVNGSVKKINDCEAVVTMNGSECSIDTSLVVKPGESFEVHQILFDNPKQNRITYNFYGDATPIWGGNNYNNGWPVKYYVPGAGNGVLIIVRPMCHACGEEVFNFTIGKTELVGKNPFNAPAKIFLYYNSVLKFWDKNGNLCDGHAECGWDGSTATFRIITD